MATSQIVNAINSLLDRLAAIPFDWNGYLDEISGGLVTATSMPTTTKLFQYLALWNGQTKAGREGKGFPTTRPCVYIQPVPGKATTLGGGVKLYQNFIWKIHIVDFQVDGFNEAGGTDGTNELIGGNDQNLEIFTWRDMVVTQMQAFFPVSCGALTIIDEEPDDEHADVAHYILSFKCAFTDLQGSRYNPNAPVPYADPPQPAGQFGYVPTVNLASVLPFSKPAYILTQTGGKYVSQSGAYYITNSFDN